VWLIALRGLYPSWAQSSSSWPELLITSRAPVVLSKVNTIRSVCRVVDAPPRNIGAGKQEVFASFQRYGLRPLAKFGTDT
jgi:hypothetical protein